jgi:hypothetical protein
MAVGFRLVIDCADPEPLADGAAGVDDHGMKYLGPMDIPVDDLAAFPGRPQRADVVSAIRLSLRQLGQFRSLVARHVGGGRLMVLAGDQGAALSEIERFTP